MAGDTPSFESASVAAILTQRGREDRAALLDDLVAMLHGVVPGARVDRALFSRRVTALHLPVAGYLYVLRRSADEVFEAKRQQQVRGVVIRTDPMEIDAFLVELGLALEAELQRTDRGRAALRAWLNPKNP